jgi:hypothetical protein
LEILRTSGDSLFGFGSTVEGGAAS